MFKNLVKRLNLIWRPPFDFDFRLFAKDASCGNKTPKCGSKKGSESTCKTKRKRKDCKKTPAPYPSFSECKKEPRASKSAKECDCLKLDK